MQKKHELFNDFIILNKLGSKNCPIYIEICTVQFPHMAYLITFINITLGDIHILCADTFISVGGGAILSFCCMPSYHLSTAGEEWCEILSHNK